MNAWSCAGVGLWAPEVGGCDLYFWILVVWPRPSSFGLLNVHPAAFTAASRSVILRDGIEPDGHDPDDEELPESPPPEASAIAATATTTAPTSTAAIT